MTRRRFVLLMAVAGAVCLLAACASGTKTAVKSKPLEPTTSSTSTSTSTSTTSSSTTVTTTPASVPVEPTTVAPPRAVTTTTTTAPVNPVATPIVRAPVDGAIQITAADHYSTFAVALGQKVELTLSTAGMQWSSVMVAPAGLLVDEPSPVPPLHGQLGIFTAVEPGIVTLTSTESAVCGPPLDDACPMFIVLWTVKLIIS